MRKNLSAFSPIPSRSDLWSAQKGALRCTALKLRDGSLCLYSPVLGFSDDAKASLSTLGEVSCLLAPNHYHHKGLREYAEVFPEAKLACSDRAKPRLTKQTGLSFGGLPSLEGKFLEGYKILEPYGLKTGEVWLVAESAAELVWIVCDSFKGPSGKANSIGKNVELLGTFPTYGIEDRDVYAAWVETQVSVGAPTMIVPCHGSMIRKDDLAADVVSLAQRLVPN